MQKGTASRMPPTEAASSWARAHEIECKSDGENSRHYPPYILWDIGEAPHAMAHYATPEN